MWLQCGWVTSFHKHNHKITVLKYIFFPYPPPLLVYYMPIHVVRAAF